VRRKTPGHQLHSCVRGAAAVDSAFRGSNGTRDAALTKSGGFKERLGESLGVARATTPRGLHIFVVGRSEGPYCSRAHARTSDIEEVEEPVAGAEARRRRSLGARKSLRKRSRLSVDNPQQRRGPARTMRSLTLSPRLLPWTAGALGPQGRSRGIAQRPLRSGERRRYVPEALLFDVSPLRGGQGTNSNWGAMASEKSTAIAAREDYAPGHAPTGACRAARTRGAEVCSKVLFSDHPRRFSTLWSRRHLFSPPLGARRSLHKPWGKKELPV